MRHGSLSQDVDRLAYALAAIYGLDLALKMGVLAHFFARRLPAEPAAWPSVTILEPITRGAQHLRGNLEARARLDYPGAVQRLLLCDERDATSQAICRSALAERGGTNARIVTVRGRGTPVASKLVKLQVGLPHATGDVICLMDDDVAPRPDDLRALVRWLSRSGVGAVYALPCYRDWETPWSSLLSLFVNSYAVMSYVSMTYLAEPFRILGQMAAYRRAPLVAAGGFAGLESYLDDDYVLAQRLRATGVRAEPVPVVCDVYDGVPTWRRYAAQLKRWMMLPRRAMEPSLTPRQRTAAFLSAPATILIPSALAALVLATRRRAPIRALGVALAAYAASYAACAGFLKGRTPAHRVPLLVPAALLTPVQTALALLGSPEIEWRGQRLRVLRDGRFTLAA